MEMAVQGQGREEIETALVARFGREKMGYTQSTSVFVIVTVLAVAAVVMIVRLGKKWSAKPEAAAARNEAGSSSAKRVSQDELDDLEDDLDALDGI